MKKRAREQCKQQILDLLTCQQEQGLLMVFRCRGAHRSLNECLKPHTTEEVLNSMIDERKREMGIAE